MASRSRIRIVRETNAPLPQMSWESIFYSAQKVLRKKLLPLVVIFVSDRRSRELNARYRRKSTPTNVLTFSQDRELVIAPMVVRTEAKTFGFSCKYWMTCLIVHGIVHLEGHNHATAKRRRAMESIERKILDALE